MARPIWKGHITFGLVNIPVTLFTAEKRTRLSFHLIDSRDNARVRYERVNEVTGAEVGWSDITKAFEYDGGSYIKLDDEDFARAAAESSKAVEIEAFVDEDAIDYTYFDKPYYLVPGVKGEKGYVLLRETLRRTRKVGIARVVIRTKEYLAALLAEGDALLLNLLRYHQEILPQSDFDLPTGKREAYKINEREIDMAEKLVEAMTAPWQPEQYHDEYQARLMKFIEEKIAQGESAAAPEAPAPEDEEDRAEVVDMMELLQRSVRESGTRDQPGDKKAKGASRGGDGEGPGKRKAPARKRAAG